MVGGAGAGGDRLLHELPVDDASRTATTLAAGERKRIVAETFESILFLVFVVGLMATGALGRVLKMTEQEYVSYTTAVLTGLFLAGFAGELYWQIRNFALLEEEERSNYVINLKRSIILPYINSRQK